MESLQSVPIKWVKTKVNFRDWGKYYSKQVGYTYLRKEKEGIVIGFEVVDNYKNFEELTPEEMWQVQCHRKAARLYPLPMAEETKDKPKSQLQKMAEEATNELKPHILFGDKS